MECPACGRKNLEDSKFCSGLRENFIERIFAYKRWQLLINEPPKPSDLIAFHTSFKCILMAHHPNAQTE
ncbi:MAG: hypothetical protein CL785_03635, partial [Chloroflexi bacterium]|nr:hypothetical protein [Chloroflexota bacterium]